LASTWLTGLGATISAWWILVANAWMQYPVGCEFNPDTMRNEMVSFAEVALSPFAVSKFCHTVTSAWIIGAIFCVGVCCWYLMKKRHTKLAIESMKIGAWVGLVAALLAAATGHKSGMDVAEVQPMKLAAMEALYNGGTEQGLTAIAWVNPFSQPDYQNEEAAPLKIDIPYGLSIMATNDPKGHVPGINDILNGYTRPDGTVEPSIDEKIERGKKAIEALANYRQAKFASSDDGSAAAYNLGVLKENMKYFGYGYIKDKNDVVPYIPINFWAFRIMVGVGCLFILFFAAILFALWKKDVKTLPKWHYWVAILLIPLGYIGSECGWLVAEFGRQPWTIQDMLPTWAAVSDLNAGSVALTFFLFLILFSTMLAVEINILLKQIKKGPAL
jgi:cytochrome d ubiquinol oxidase subunit I